MCADGVAVFNGRREARTDDWPTGCGINCAPLKRMRCDSELVRVGCRVRILISKINRGMWVTISADENKALTGQAHSPRVEKFLSFLF